MREETVESGHGGIDAHGCKLTVELMHEVWQMAGIFTDMLSRCMQGQGRQGQCTGHVEEFSCSRLVINLAEMYVDSIVAATCGSLLDSGSRFIARVCKNQFRPVASPPNHPGASRALAFDKRMALCMVLYAR